jgi:TetR/AcrR family transcriptional repressor of nem operon
MIKITTKNKILDITFLLVYKYGYTGTSTSMILKECGIPKGSLYHHFSSKKDLVLTVLKERIKPKMNEFFEFKKIKNQNPIDTIIKSIKKIANNQYLINYGCPLNRLNQEMGNLDENFEKEINIIYEDLKQRINTILEDTDTKEKDSLSEYIINTTWGALSFSAKQASKKRFLKNISHLVDYLESLK